MNNNAWQKARVRARLTEVRVHDLKHTFGRRLRAAGVSFEDRQDLLGHRSGRITTHYSAAELQNLLDASNRVCEEGSRKTPLGDKRMRVSRLPLTLGALEVFFNRAWSLLDVLAANFSDSGYDLNRMLSFVVGVESEFYPQIGELYTRRIAAWAAERSAEREDD